MFQCRQVWFAYLGANTIRPYSMSPLFQSFFNASFETKVLATKGILDPKLKGLDHAAYY